MVRPAKRIQGEKESRNDSVEVAFVAAFDGPALETGRMNAKDLAPSLFAHASLVERASETIFSGRNALAVQVRADFRRGSFEFGLIATAAAIVGQQVLQNLSVSDIDLLLRYIGFRGAEPNSLFGLLRRIGARPVERIVAQPDGRVSIHVSGDNATVIIGDVHGDVARLAMNDAVRETLPEIVAPLRKPGIEKYRAGASNKPSIVLTKQDLAALQPPPTTRSELTDDTSTQALELLAPSFVDGNKWRVAQGAAPYWVTILDTEFLGSVASGERGFRRGDYLIVEMRIRAYDTMEGLQVEHGVLKVLDHRHRGRTQLPLL